MAEMDSPWTQYMNNDRGAFSPTAERMHLTKQLSPLTPIDFASYMSPPPPPLKKRIVKSNSYIEQNRLDHNMNESASSLDHELRPNDKIIENDSNIVVVETFPTMSMLQTSQKKMKSTKKIVTDAISSYDPSGEFDPGYDLSKTNKKQFGDDATSLLTEWILQNQNNPYPTQSEKDLLADSSNLSVQQVTDWLTNTRKRHLFPVISGKKIAKTPLEKIFIANALSSSQTQAQMNPTMIGYWPQKSNDV